VTIGPEVCGFEADILLHVPLRLSWLNSAFSADIALIRLPEPLNQSKGEDTPRQPR
jgi:hypothetical protein